ECTVSSLERTLALVFSPSSSVFPACQVPVTMRSLRLFRTPFLCGLIWAFCAPGARAEEPRASPSHHGSVGLDKHTVHDQEYEGSEQAPLMSEDELINLIDGVLRDDDKNNDGYIDYAEFAKSLQ
ncbi:hypothetical protein HPG69_009095, partial [Diceros bicornis minor]